MDRITQKGIDQSLELLYKAGYLELRPCDSPALDLMYLIGACEKFVDDSKTKGSARTHEEELNAMLILFFEKYLLEQLSEIPR